MPPLVKQWLVVWSQAEGKLLGCILMFIGPGVKGSLNCGDGDVVESPPKPRTTQGRWTTFAG